MAVFGFRRTRSGRVVVRLDDAERTTLRVIVGQLLELVAPPDEPDADPLARMVGIDASAVTPTDPALARLLPDAYSEDDQEAAGEFRRFTERSLREGKVANARTILACIERSGPKITLSTGEARAWLTSLNDLRLALGTRLDIDEDPDVMDGRIAELSRTVLVWDPAGEESADRAQVAMEALAAHQLYDWLTFLQETLVRAVSSAYPPGPDPE